MLAALYLIAALLGALAVHLARRNAATAARAAYVRGLIDGLESANKRWVKP